MKKKKILGSLLAMMVAITSSFSLAYAEDVGSSLDTLKDIPIIKVSDPTKPLEANVDSNSLVFRYEPSVENLNLKWNGKDFSEAPPAATPAFAEKGYISLQPGDKVTYNNKFNQKVTYEAKSYVPDFKAGANTSIGTVTPFITSEFDISVEGETRPTYIAITDLDYSDTVGLKKSDITHIVVKDENQITYTEKDGYIFFHGLQGRNGTSPSNQKLWVTALLKSTKASIKVSVGNVTLIEFDKTKLFPEGQDIAVGSVMVRYITDDGQILEDSTDVVRNVHINTPYKTEEKVFDGYTFAKLDDNSAEIEGLVTEGEKIVTYIYKKIDETNIPEDPSDVEDPNESDEPSDVEDPNESDEPSDIEDPNNFDKPVDIMLYNDTTSKSPKTSDPAAVGIGMMAMASSLGGLLVFKRRKK